MRYLLFFWVLLLSVPYSKLLLWCQTIEQSPSEIRKRGTEYEKVYISNALCMYLSFIYGVLLC